MSLVNLGHSGALDISVKHDKYLGEAYRSCVAYSLIQGRSMPWPIRKKAGVNSALAKAKSL